MKRCGKVRIWIVKSKRVADFGWVRCVFGRSKVNPLRKLDGLDPTKRSCPYILRRDPAKILHGYLAPFNRSWAGPAMTPFGECSVDRACRGFSRRPCAQILPRDPIHRSCKNPTTETLPTNFCRNSSRIILRQILLLQQLQKASV